MALIKLVTIHDDIANGDLRERRYKVVITTNSLVDEEYIIGPFIVPVTDTGLDAATDFLAQLADIEANSGGDIIAEYQLQPDYDRRALGRAMLLTDVDEFYAVLPLFLAVETRGGANANQRAIYLGTSTATYNLIADRFGDVQGIAFFLDNAKGQIWDELPGEFI